MPQQMNIAPARPAVAASCFRVATARQPYPRRCCGVASPARRRFRASFVPKSSSSSSVPIIGANDDAAADSDGLPSHSTTSTSDPMRPYRRAQARSMLRFMAPAALIPLADPLLTLVDVLFVSHGGDILFPPSAGGGLAGLLGHALSSSSSSSSSSLGTKIAATATEQLAALSPNAQIFTFIQYMLGGLGEFSLISGRRGCGVRRKNL